MNAAMAATPTDTRASDTVTARVQHRGKILYLGRFAQAEAREVEAEARAELVRTGRASGARTARTAPGFTAHQGDAMIWAADSNSDEGEDAPGAAEKRLLLALVENAVVSLRSKSPKERLEAEAWFASDDRSYPFAFASICDAFGLEPEFLRRALPS